MFNPDTIVIHHTDCEDTAGLQFDNILDYHVDVKGWDGIGYHAVIEKVEDIYAAIIGRPWTEMAAHARGINYRSLGLAFMGRYSAERLVPDEMIAIATRRVILPWTFIFGIEPERIIGHRDHKSTLCPGDPTVVDRIKELL